MLREPLCEIGGWVASVEDEPLDTLAFTVGTSVVSYSVVSRPDVMAAYPGYQVLGFSILLDLGQHLSLDRHGSIVVDVQIGRERARQLRFTPEPDVFEEARDSSAAFREKRAWCLDHLACPVCGRGSDLRICDRVISCEGCGTCFLQESLALNLLTPDLARASDLRPAGPISSNSYDPVALRMIDTVRRQGGKVLDCGAGLRTRHDRTVINLEIVDYPTTDVIAVAQALPFREGSFDAVLSLSVLEHVSDPFQCASEMVRVLKPEGTLYCVVPFLQPEHGYPEHFYNMTRKGITNLFKGKMIIDEQFVPASGLPIWCLHWFLREYSLHLRGSAREKFNAMRVSDFLARTPVDFLDEEIVTDLHEAGNWTLACTTALIGRKAS